MKAVLHAGFGGPEVLRLGEAPAPEATAGRVLIRVVATSVNRPDAIQREGRYPPPPGESEILGLEAAGTVEAVGPGVDAFSPGDRVLALLPGGGYAELAAAPAGQVMRIPERLSFEQAACIAESYITAYLNVFLLGRLAAGETVLVHGGSGGVGTAAIQLCRALAPRATVIATASAAKAERVAALGAARVVDYGSEDFADAVLGHTDGRGADVILDHIGGPYLARNLKALAIGGRLVVIGVMGGRSAELDVARLMMKRQQILGSVLRPRSVAEKSAIIERFASEVLPLFASGTIAPVIDRVYPMAEAAEAHRAMEAGEHFGKIVLKW